MASIHFPGLLLKLPKRHSRDATRLYFCEVFAFLRIGAPGRRRMGTAECNVYLQCPKVVAERLWYRGGFKQPQLRQFDHINLYCVCNKFSRIRSKWSTASPRLGNLVGGTSGYKSYTLRVRPVHVHPNVYLTVFARGYLERRFMFNELLPAKAQCLGFFRQAQFIHPQHDLRRPQSKHPLQFYGLICFPYRERQLHFQLGPSNRASARGRIGHTVNGKRE